MYDFKLNSKEKIVLIDDDVVFKNKAEYLTIIITNERLLVLDYPSSLYNSNEDLRTSGRLNYIKMKEVILSKELTEIKTIETNSEYSKIVFTDDTYLEIKSEEVINKLKDYMLDI